MCRYRVLSYERAAPECPPIACYAKRKELTMVDPLLSLSIRAVSLIALLLWVPVVASFRFAPGTQWAAYVGIFYHLAVFLLVFKLPAPEWARAAGYSWLLLDVAAGTLNINQDCVDRGLYQQRGTIKHTETVAYITLRRDSEPNVYCTRNMRVQGVLGILREKALSNPVPHLLRRNVLNPPRLGVRSGLCFSWATILRSTSRFLRFLRTFSFERILLPTCVRARK